MALRQVDDWRKVIWTDESYIWIGGLRGKVYVTRAAGEQYKNDCLLPTFKKEFPTSIMIWGGICGDRGQKVLVLWNKGSCPPPPPPRAPPSPENCLPACAVESDRLPHSWRRGLEKIFSHVPCVLHILRVLRALG